MTGVQTCALPIWRWGDDENGTVTQWHYKVRNRGRVEGYPAIDGEGQEEGLDHKKTVGKTTLILQGIGVDAPRWKVIEQQDPLPYGRGDQSSIVCFIPFC